MTRSPSRSRRDTLAAEALHILEQRKITSIVVVDADQQVEGVVHLHDLWRTRDVLIAPDWHARSYSARCSPCSASRCSSASVVGQGLGALQAARRPLDRSPPPARDAALHARPELPGRQPGRSGDRRADAGDEHRRHRRARDPDDPRQPVPRRRDRSAARSTCTRRCCSGRTSRARARLRPAVPRPRLQARRLRRSRARGVPGSRAAGPAEPLRARQPAEAARRTAPVGRCGCASASRSRSSMADADPSDQQILGFLATRSAARSARDGDAAAAARTFASAIDIDARTAPGLSEPRRRARARRADLAGAIDAWERSSRERPGARVSGLRSPRARLCDASARRTVRRALPNA